MFIFIRSEIKSTFTNVYYLTIRLINVKNHLKLLPLTNLPAKKNMPQPQIEKLKQLQNRKSLKIVIITKMQNPVEQSTNIF